MKKRSWRESFNVFAKSQPFDDKFDNYKLPKSKGELPNRAEFSGDKLPSSGDPAKKELTHWKDGESQFNKDKKVEDKTKVPSPIMFEDNRREHIGKEKSERKSGWRNTLLKFSDVNFNQAPDGGIKIEVTKDSTDDELETASEVIENLPLEENITESSKFNWRKVLSSDADMDFSRKPDGTMTLKVKHLSDDENSAFPSSQTPQTPELATPSPVQESFSVDDTVNTAPPNAMASLSFCKDKHPETTERIIREDSNHKRKLQLIARECDDKVGVFIEQRTKGTIASYRVKGNIKVLASDVIERNGKQWRELINEAVWIAKYDDFLRPK